MALKRAWGAAWGKVAGSRRPTPTASLLAAANATVRPGAPKKPIRWGEAAKNLGLGLARIAGFIARHPVLCAGVLIVAAYLIFVGPRLPFEWGKSKDALRLEIALAEAEAHARKLEMQLASRALRLSELTRSREEGIHNAVEQAQEDIDNAVDAQDFDRLFAAYERGYRGVLNPASANPSNADPAPPRPPGMRGPSSDRA